MSSAKWQPCCLGIDVLTHCGLVTLYGDRDLGKHWLTWRHQAITWTNIDLSSGRSSGIHLSAILQEIPQIPKPPIAKISLKITYLNFHWNLPGANELMLFLNTYNCVVYVLPDPHLIYLERRSIQCWEDIKVHHLLGLKKQWRIQTWGIHVRSVWNSVKKVVGPHALNLKS